MRIYLASWFSSKDEMNNRAAQLRGAGIEVTSRWLQETVKPTTQIKDVSTDYLRETAQIDIEDIMEADIVVLNVPGPKDLARTDMPISSWARGGRHFEAGFQYATMVFEQFIPMVPGSQKRRLILIGGRENVFHYLDGLSNSARGYDLPSIEIYDTWEPAFKMLVSNAVAERSIVEAHVG